MSKGKIPEIEIKDNPFHRWTRVELWRWQYGELPKPDDERELDVVKGLRNMAEAFKSGDEIPTTVAASQALEYAAYLIEQANSTPSVTKEQRLTDQQIDQEADRIVAESRRKANKKRGSR